MSNDIFILNSKVIRHCDYCGDLEVELRMAVTFNFAERSVCYDCVAKALDKLLGPPTLEKR